MNLTSEHSFHIPVMGLGYTIDTPVKAARYGISSVVSVIQDHLVEQMREHYCKLYNEEYIPVLNDNPDRRAIRITLYLNLLNKIVNKQMEELKNQLFEEGNDIMRYFRLLPSDSHSAKLFEQMLKAEESEKKVLQDELRTRLIAGDIDVNIMTKADNMNRDTEGNLLPVEYADAMAALRGFALSDLSSSIVFSAGMNPRLYSYLEKFPDFFPDKNGFLKKKVILKVSDYRSALIQGKFLAKKGIWISEFRIESGLNCGGHAFPTDGLLAGPILEEFKANRKNLQDELSSMCNNALKAKNNYLLQNPYTKVSYQGGIGTAEEDSFLRKYYQLNTTGWGSPFLLVPEVTNVEDETLEKLANAKKEDYYLSHTSPFGIPINNFRNSSSEELIKQRIEKQKPGSPCIKKYLAFNTEFTDKPICVSSREYQNLKIRELNKMNLPAEEYKKRYDEITEKECLCEGLSAATRLKYGIKDPGLLDAVAICPGPNLAFFSGIFSLDEMVDHIYGRINLRNAVYRPHVFINELSMYVDYLKEDLIKNSQNMTDKLMKHYSGFKNNLQSGIDYYKELASSISFSLQEEKNAFLNELDAAIKEITLLKTGVAG